MSTAMRAKFQVTSVEKFGEPVTSEKIHFMAVTGTDPFGPDGASDDNTYARYTPSADAHLLVNNPALLGKYAAGQKYYVDFTPAE